MHRLLWLALAVVSACDNSPTTPPPPPPNPSFEIAAAPVRAQAGIPDTLAVTATRHDGEAGAIILSVAGNGQNIQGGGSIPAGATTGTVRFVAPESLAAGAYTITIGGVDGQRTASTNATVTVIAYPTGADASSSYTIARWNARQSLIDWTQIAQSGEFLLARTVADLDGDGVPELVVAPGMGGTMVGTPMRFYEEQAGPSAPAFSDVTKTLVTGEVPALVHGRKLILGDYNGDHTLDLFVCAHGYDAPPFPGTVNALLLSDGAGHFAAATQPWTGTVGYHHGCASADIDGDGDLDIFVTNSSATSYFLLNDGHGNFTQDTTRLPASLARQEPVFVTELFDLDGDGKLDLAVGGGETYVPTTIYWGEGSGAFTDASSTVVPAVLGWQNPLVFAAEDLDGDGKRELVVGRTKGQAGDPDFYKGYTIQVLTVGARQLTDVTAAWAQAPNGAAPTLIVDGNGDPTWIDWVWVADQDLDGRPDLIGSTVFEGNFVARNQGASFAAWQKQP